MFLLSDPRQHFNFYIHVHSAKTVYDVRNKHHIAAGIFSYATDFAHIFEQCVCVIYNLCGDTGEL